MPGADVEFFLAIRSDIRIDAARARIWGFLDRQNEWKSSVVSIEHTGGFRGQEGEQVRIAQRPGDETVHVLMDTVRLEPHAWRVQTLITEMSRATDGFVIYSLDAEGSSTRLVCEVIARCILPVSHLRGATADNFARRVNDATRQKLDADLRALKALAEKEE